MLVCYYHGSTGPLVSAPSPLAVLNFAGHETQDVPGVLLLHPPP